MADLTQQPEGPAPKPIEYKPLRTENSTLDKKQENTLLAITDRQMQEQILRTLVSIDKSLSSINLWMRIGFFFLIMLAIAVFTRIGEMRVY